MIAWVARAEPLTPVAVAARGDRARALVRELVTRDLAGLSGVAEPTGGRDVVVLLGQAERLPWTHDVVYLGVAEGAPSLLLPTTEAPAWPASLFERAVRRHVAGHHRVAVLPHEDLFVGVDHARPLERSILEAWLG